MSRSYEYVCPACENRITRQFRVPSVVRTCENDCGFDHYIRADILEKVESVPEEARPDNWAEMDNEKRVYVALREDVISLPDLQ